MYRSFLAPFSMCTQPGARAAIRKICKTLQLEERAAQPSHATLHRFGNTSGASIYYILAHLESRIGVKKGDKVRSDIGRYTLSLVLLIHPRKQQSNLTSLAIKKELQDNFIALEHLGHAKSTLKGSRAVNSGCRQHFEAEQATRQAAVKKACCNEPCMCPQHHSPSTQMQHVCHGSHMCCSQHFQTA